MRAVPGSELPGADLTTIITGALDRCGWLLTAGELYIARQILALPAPALELYARLSLRVGSVFRLQSLAYEKTVVESAGLLVEWGLALDQLPDSLAAQAFGVAELKEACRKQGLSQAGNRSVLLERLKNLNWIQEPVLMLGQPGLLRRLELLFFQQSWLDRKSLILERLQLQKFPDYTPTPGPGRFSCRQKLLRYERFYAGQGTEAEALEIVSKGPEPENPYRPAMELLLASPPEIPLLKSLVEAGLPFRHRLALALEAAGEPQQALSVCREPEPSPVLALALYRTGQRLARKLKSSWPPRQSHQPVTRSLRLPKAASYSGNRPLWRVGERELLVEEAVIARLQEAGFQAEHTENWLWRSLFALCFQDFYWLPVPNMLPGPKLLGPLDLDTPAFYEARKTHIEARLDEIRQEGIVKYTTDIKEEALAGLAWPEAVASLATKLSGPLVATVLQRLAMEGWASAHGLPDLLVVGNGGRVEGLIAPQLPAGCCLVEVKGPGDTLSDAQAVWLDQLAVRGNSVEVWHVRE